jgi:hypothetical protein
MSPSSIRRGVNPMDHEHSNEHDSQLHDGQSLMEQTENPVCYHQNCPVCGRNLRIRVMLLGRRVYCQHCGGGFIATDACVGATTPRVPNRPQSAIVDDLIERAAVMLGLTSGQDSGLDVE